jgi:proliferating cell nuclear antigen
MWTATLSDTGTGLLREAMSAISELIDEAELRINKDGIRLTAADRAVVAVVDFWLGANAFSQYRCDSDLRLGINLLSLLKTLRRSGSNDVLSMASDGKQIEIKFVGNGFRTFVLPVIDVSKEELPNIDKLTFSASFEIPSEILGSGIEDADLIADSVVLSLRNDRLLMRAEADSSVFELEIPAEKLKSITADQASRARYSLDYLKKIMKAKRFAEHARIDFGTDYPARIVFDIPDKARLLFVLAPRVE